MIDDASNDNGKPAGEKAVNAGESAGGAYPNPHSGTSEDTPDGGKAYEDDHGGDAGIGYHGGGKAGRTDYEGERKD